MLEKLPSLLDFQPKFCPGGLSRFHLALLHDLVVVLKPKTIVLLGFGDGQACFTACQTVREQEIDCRVTAVRRQHAGDNEIDDQAWREGKDYGQEFYGDLIRFVDGSSAETAKDFADGSVDLLLLDDSDSGAAILSDLSLWQAKLSANGLVAVHGIMLKRADDDPKTAWRKWSVGRTAAEFPDGIGLGIISVGDASRIPNDLKKFFDPEEIPELIFAYRLAAARIEAQARLDQAVRSQAALETRQVWLDSLLADRWKVQEIMDHQARVIGHLERTSQAMLAERAKTDAATAQSSKLEGGKVSEKALSAADGHSSARYRAWIHEHEPNALVLEEQRCVSAQLKVSPKISLLTPVYNTSGKFLAEMFASVCAQTYPNWELCVVDGGSDRAETLETIQAWSARDSRIRLERLESNLGIAENTNCALQRATGDFFACLDHDDLLAPFALFELARAIGDSPEADIFYSDEDRWDERGERHSPFLKPEWSPVLLTAFMYIGHLTAYRRSLADEIGAFRKEFDLSQDYDFALRATERARAIRHIPHVLYHWREHPASGSVGGKPEARKSNLAALEAAMRRRHLPAEIIEYPTANRARLTISPWARVSVIVPTDSLIRAQLCVSDLPRKTEYPFLEIVVVTKSELIKSLKVFGAESATVRLVAYDKPFNFSEKCNLGAAAATGERLIFFNDDVETNQPDWIQNLIEPLENPEVGGVSPKLLYETGRIQHAGLVMGVRSLAGTAFHEHDANSPAHFNLAQSLRDVAALSAACLAVRREDFIRLGGFDAVNTPIAHSDIDLCFKMREAGLRCVYTPYATLTHAGHASIAVEEKKAIARQRDKASIYLLKRWPSFATHDPYFPDNMRDWLYPDSPPSIRMVAGARRNAIHSRRDLLFVSHDLSLSGAPLMLLHAAEWCQQNGDFVVVMTPKDGPLLDEFRAKGITIIVDPLIESGHYSFGLFARDFDCVVANTIRSGAAVGAAQKENIPVVWWLHEPEAVGRYCIGLDAKLPNVFPLADVLVAPSEHTAAVYRSFTDRPVRCVRNAIPDCHPPASGKSKSPDRPLHFVVLGGMESRKGQDVFVEALASLPRSVQEAGKFQIAGRILDPDYWAKVAAVAMTVKNFSVKGALNRPQAMELVAEADVLVCPSRDEAMPTVAILEGMCLGKALIVTAVGGADEVLVEGDNALLVRSESPADLAVAIRRLIQDRELAFRLGAKARETYERNFTMERFGAEFREMLEEPISRHASPVPRRSL
ncbi:MAG: glycosyltransferase [Verrucomicrobiota bacterium]|nr:glycosyltransferase [Verrucomicrobiota bacterium]